MRTSTSGVTSSFPIRHDQQQGNKAIYERNNSHNRLVMIDQIKKLRPNLDRNSSDAANSATAARNSTALFAITACFRFTTGKPAAPSDVVTTGTPIAKASSSFTRWPVP